MDIEKLHTNIPMVSILKNGESSIQFIVHCNISEIQTEKYKILYRELEIFGSILKTLSE